MPIRATPAVRDDVTQTSRLRLRQCRSTMVGRQPGREDPFEMTALRNSPNKPFLLDFLNPGTKPVFNAPL
jgi:hypothetical protein